MFLNSSIMMMLTTFILLLVLVHVSGTLYGPKLLISHVGGSVTIKCYYSNTAVNKHDRKYWCKEAKGSRRCQTIISTNDFTFEDYKGRVSIKDIPQTGVLQVTVTQLEKKDSGNYRCGIGKKNDGLYARMNLTIWEGRNLPKSPEMLWGKRKGSVTIHCPSESVEPSMRLSLCKLTHFGCRVVDSNSDGGEQRDGRIALTTEDGSRTFKVVINKLRSEDSGMYKCGTGNLDADATIVQLQVIEEPVFSNILRHTQVMPEPQTTGTSIYSHDIDTYKYVTTGIYEERSSKTEPSLLSIVLPVLIILSVLAASIITVLVKKGQRRMHVISTIAARNPGGEIPLTIQTRTEEHPEEENRETADEQDAAVGPGKEVPTTSVYCLVSHTPNPEDLREND